MKALIVNADDFGLSPGVTRGILEAHRNGVVTSTSFMVDALGSEEAARRASEAPRLSIGLHAEIAAAYEGLAPDDACARWRAELEWQLEQFRRLLGRDPTHLDSHHSRHRDLRVAPVFVEVARRHGIPLREHSDVRYFSKFYGRWGGSSHPEHIEFASLASMLREIGDGVTELSCHPGYAGLDSGYDREREIEVRTLCDPRLPRVLEKLRIVLVSYDDITNAGRAGVRPEARS